jgi:hypothetical protein
MVDTWTSVNKPIFTVLRFWAKETTENNTQKQSDIVESFDMIKRINQCLKISVICMPMEGDSPTI